MNNKNHYLFFLMMLDYIFTYIGINFYGIIEEANPILIALFSLPFAYGFLIRLVYCFLMYTLLEFVYKEEYKHYNKLIFGLLSVNVFVLMLHLNWIKILFEQVFI